MTLKWNLVTKNLHGHQLLRKKLRQKITKLERHLKHFPSDAVHLHIALERHPKKELHTAALTLRVPSNILGSEKSSPDVIKAFDDAVKALLRELESLKAELRRETFWKRKSRRGATVASGNGRFEEQPHRPAESERRDSRTAGGALFPVAALCAPPTLARCHCRRRAARRH